MFENSDRDYYVNQVQGDGKTINDCRQYPNMTPIFSAIEDRGKHRELIVEVIKAAKVWRESVESLIPVNAKASNYLTNEQVLIARAVDALVEFEAQEKSA